MKTTERVGEIANKLRNTYILDDAQKDCAYLIGVIDRLICCGNCKSSAINLTENPKMLCKMRTMGAMDNYAKEKCDKWQAVK